MHNLSSLINNKYKLIGGDMMSPKELLYIQDALGHAQHMEKNVVNVHHNFQMKI